MAKSQINTKSRNYSRDKETFLKDLKQFNESKNIPYKVPVVNGVDIDLYLLYSLVQQRGGLSRVNQNDTWESFLRQLRLPHPCINGSTLLRRIYGTYLEKYERAKGPPRLDDDNDMDEDLSRRGRGGGMPRITFGSGTYISASGEPLRTGNRVAGPSERLTLSLLSPMPNEQDFAVNVCTVLAADHSNRLPLSTTPHILDFLLAHAGVYNHSSLRDTIGRSYYEARGRYPHDFWQLRAGGGGAKELADETKFMQPGIEQPELMVQALAAHNTLTDCLMQGAEDDDSLEKIVEEDLLEDWVTEPSEEEQLFAPELSGGASCVYTQRVLQIASIVRSLSFHEENVQYLARNTTLIRFLLLCANCWVGTLRQSGLDTLGNVSTELIIKDPATCLISRHVISTIQSALISQDRARVLAALELLNKLAQNEANEDALLKALEAKVYSDVCALLTLRDIMVLVCTLECVYALTALGDRACEAVARVPGLLQTLVSLVTVEAQSYGPRACILMRVVETVSGPQAVAATGATSATGEADKPHPPPTTQSQPSTPSKPSAEPAPLAVTSSAAPVAVPATAPMSTLQQSHIQQRTVQENEHFVQAWLRASYEALPASDNSTCDAADVYRQYLACCTKLSRKGVIAPAHFPRLVRTVFGGTVGPNTVSTSSGETQHVYIGIRAKNPPSRTNPPAGPSSPILKAQLTNKPATSEPKPPPPQPQIQQQPSHPALSQALEATPSNTSLIKHLLAHKVSPAPASHAQVAQRQQSQQRAGPAQAGTVVVQPSQAASMEVDPESLIKYTTIIPGGVTTSQNVQGDKMIVSAVEEVIVPKEEAVQIQIDEQAQLTIKTAQNKMLADLLEKKSNPPVQVVPMGQQINAPTIQITETGQIVQVKSENPLIQINSDNVQASGPFFQIKNDQGQLIQIKNDQGQIIQLKGDQLQGLLQFKNDQGQMVQIKNDQGQMVQFKNDQVQGQMVQYKNDQGQMVQIKNDQGQMVQFKNDQGQGQMVQYKNDQGQMVQIKNDQGQMLQFKNDQGQMIQLKNDQGQMVQLKNDQGQMVQLKNDQGQMVQFKNDQGQMVQFKNDQGHIVQFKNDQNQMAQFKNDQGQMVQFKNDQGQIVQFKNDQGQMVQFKNDQGQMVQIKSDQLVPQLVQQSVIQSVKTEKEQMIETVVTDHSYTEPPSKKMKIDDKSESNSPQESVSKTAANLYAAIAASALEDEDDLVQQPTLQVQQPTLQVQQPTLQVQQPTLQVHQASAIQVQQPTLQMQQPMLQVQPMDVQNIIASQSGQIILQEKQMSSQAAQFMQQPMQIIATPGTSQGGLSYIAQNIPGNMMQKTIIIVQGTGGGPLTLTVNNPTGLDEATLNSLIAQATEAITQQQIIQNTGVIQSTQRVIVSQPTLVSTSQPIAVVKTTFTQNAPQITPSQQPIITTQPQPHKAQIVNQAPTQQIVVTQKQPPALISTSSNNQIIGNQIVGSNQQIIQGNQQLLQGNQQIIAVSNNQQIIMNAPMKQGVHRVVQQSQRSQGATVPVTSAVATGDGKTGTIQSVKSQQPVMRQVITRQPVMVGNTKIGDKEMIITQPVTETKPPPIKKTVTPPPQPSPAAAEETPWICHWRGCGKIFSNASEVFSHAARTHCPNTAGGEAPCMWLDCDRVPRRTFALLNHLTDKHCSPHALKAIFNTRRHIAAEAEANKPVSVGYPPNAALAALNKHATDTLNPRELMDENEGPVTKSIRLTAALILRNIVIYSNTGRRLLRSFEAHLAVIALSNVEASRTIAQVLYDMNNI